MRSPLRPADPRRLGQYRLEARLGQGGMGTVYLGRGRDGRAVAIKAVKSEFAYDPEFRARFRSEVNRARQVPPFCTAEVLDADADHEIPYLVTEYVDGPSLAEVVAEQGPLTGGNLHSVAIGVATALAAIHGAGVIHRDLKPRNVLFALGHPKVIDFGIARAFEATSHHTATDQMVGTVAYMAPERFDTATDRVAGPAADVFAWGVIVTYAGTGRTPFAADSPVATAAGILTQPPDLGDLPTPLRDLVAAALAKDPARRPTAAQLIDALVAYGVPPAPTAVIRATTPSRSPAAGAATARGPRRRRWAIPVLAAASVAAVAAGILAFGLGRDLAVDGRPEAGDLVAPPPSSGAPTLADPATPTRSATPARSAAPAGPAEPTRSATANPAGAGVTAEPLPTGKARLCTNADIKVSISAQSENPTAVGTQRGLISVANRSGTPCRVDGRAFVRLYNAADEPVTVPTTTVDEPGEAVDILLEPGGGAFQGMKWQACDRDSSDCPTGNSLRGSLVRSSPGVVAELLGFPDPNRSQLTIGSLRLGTLQPSTQGVVAW
ncbi:serine/threonine protein kinase [Paractinoplanes brasiliensis]|uniref:Serine/threonine protein kinase n=1 Tax=Paractinoplanes brasiliensis TaxID=52695 RepID=A0A4R6JLD9_9ACTN|nr:protein kinase [Actinoplanes brasiliensis]TDO36597.1 serine/threonine protein kinase [Actinoplanes brasiliensis]